MHKTQSGGDKVARKHAYKIHSQRLGGFTSQLLHPFHLNETEKKNSFTNQVTWKTDLKFSKDHDFVIIPEYMATPSGNKLAELGIKYAIFVQGGYIMNTPLYLYKREELDAAYKHASIILSISEDTTENIKLIYPEYKDKILRVYLSVDSNLYKSSNHKENLISYMPRRLNKHAELIKFFLESKLPTGWKFTPIQNMDEAGVAEALGKSKIFLSLSELEGFGLPPLEAGLSGNYVVGYTGQGGKEFWQTPIFTEVNNGDIKYFCKVVLDKVNNYNNFDSSLFASSRTNLAATFSDQNETTSLIKLTERINQILDSKIN